MSKTKTLEKRIEESFNAVNDARDALSGALESFRVLRERSTKLSKLFQTMSESIQELVTEAESAIEQMENELTVEDSTDAESIEAHIDRLDDAAALLDELSVVEFDEDQS